MSQRMPAMAYALGAAGLLPLLLCAVAAISAGPERVLGMQAMIAYAAVILSFLGAVHWGLALATPAAWAGSAAPSARHQLVLSTIPALLGWAALLLMLISLPVLGIALLIGGFIATAATEAHWSRAGLLPAGYMSLRWVLSVLVVVILGVVVAIRLFGTTVSIWPGTNG